MVNFIQNKYRNRIADKLIFYLLIFSSLITLLTTSFQLFQEYQRDRNYIIKEFVEIKTSYKTSLSSAVWIADHGHLKNMLKGITELPDFIYADIRVDNKILVSSGDKVILDSKTLWKKDRGFLHTEMPLLYRHRGQLERIGELRMVATMDNVYKRLYQRVWLIIVSNGIKTILVMTFVFFIFNWLVTSRLFRIVRHIRNFIPGKPMTALELDKKPHHSDELDELDELAKAISMMQCNVTEVIKRQDITEHQLRSRQAEFEALFNSNPDAVVYFDTERRMQIINSTTMRLFGYTGDELIGNGISILYANQDRQHHVQESKTDHRPYIVSYKRKDGSLFRGETLSTTVTVQDGKLLGFIDIIRDVTEKLELMDALRDSQSMLSGAERIAHIGSWKLDITSNVLIWSEEVYRIFEIDPEKFDASYEAFLETVHPEDRIKVNQVYINSIKSKEPYDIEHRLLMSDGRIKYVREICETTFDEDGQPITSLGSVHDITERKNIETELEKYHRELELLVDERTRELNTAHQELVRKERLATLGQLTATVSHELRNPLGAMRPSLYVLNKSLPAADERLRKAFERLDRNIDRCDHIIDELLDFTRITDLDKHATNIDSWLETILAEQTIPQDITLRQKRGLGTLSVDIDTNRLQRAIINVVDNACQAMQENNLDKGGGLAMELTVTTREHHGRIEIVVEDTGPGIDKEIRPHIFEPLYSTKGFGVGLGLPTVKQILEQHQGGIEINNREKGGTSVVLWIPKRGSHEVAA